ncbi:YraN family protein [Patescibacteria group bacterium]
MNSKQTGILGEKIASEYLKSKGYEILGKNYIPKFVSGPKRGEIDIIAKKDDVIVFVEVKALVVDNQNSAPLISPEEKVNFQKQRKIIKTAQDWLMEKKVYFNSKWQIDVVSIRINKNTNKAKIQHFQNAVF